MKRPFYTTTYSTIPSDFAELDARATLKNNTGALITIIQRLDWAKKLTSYEEFIITVFYPGNPNWGSERNNKLRCVNYMEARAYIREQSVAKAIINSELVRVFKYFDDAVTMVKALNAMNGTTQATQFHKKFP